MTRNRRPATNANRDRWLVSYADFITLLFAFFVVMFASAQVDRAKMSKLANAMEGAFHGSDRPRAREIRGCATGTESSTDRKVVAVTDSMVNSVEYGGIAFSKSGSESLRHELEMTLRSEIAKGDVALHVGSEGLVVSLSAAGFFDSGSSSVTASSKVVLIRIGTMLRRRYAVVRVEGHTDDKPIHTRAFRSNWDLSVSRATEVIKIFMTDCDFPPDHLSAAGFAEFHPVASNETVDGRQRNRRVDIVVLGIAPEVSKQRSSIEIPR